MNALHQDGYGFITPNALKEFRLHPTIRLLLGTAKNCKEEADKEADRLVTEQIDSGQGLNYGAVYMQASIRAQFGVFISEYQPFPF